MVSVVAPIRCAMNRSASGEIALSCSETRNQDGLLFQPAAVAFSLSAATESGRWVEHDIGHVHRHVGAERLPELLLLDVQIGTARGAGRVVGSRAAVLASRGGGNGCCTLAQLSPTSSPNAARKTRPVTFSRPADAWPITAPP